MTIAACYVSAEGVVLGADSTSTYSNGGDKHYFNNAQKLFQVGSQGAIGIVTWGLGGLAVKSYRTIIAQFGDELQQSPPKSMGEVANRWTKLITNEYFGAPALAGLLARYTQLHDIDKFGPNPRPRTAQEDAEYQELRSNYFVGFCIGGHLTADREPVAYEVQIDLGNRNPTPVEIKEGYRFWGAPTMAQRLIYGCDDELAAAILNSGMWTGNEADLLQIILKQQLAHPQVPIRDAIDFIHTCIQATIKAFKFSSLSQICGGPIELAVVTTDRDFRWVRHKPWDAAILEGGQL
jgi:hypothetical protein